MLKFQDFISNYIKKIGPTRIIVLSFVFIIIAGTLLLMLPISNKRDVLPFIDNFFMATSATCVTGLSTTVVFEQYSLFGQIVILLLIQIGGLGLMSILAFFFSFISNKFGVREKNMIKDAINATDLNNVKVFLRKIFKYTLIFESLGTIAYMFVFVGEFGLINGFYNALFLSISAFCNAGIDILGNNSLIGYVDNSIINITTMLLIITGGLGFVVWNDLSKNIRISIKNNDSLKVLYKHLSMNTKIVLFMTVVLLVSSFIFIFVLELSNSKTIGDMTLNHKIMTSMFNATTLRTAGFSTVDYSLLNRGTLLIMSIYMLIGGSPGGTAGGIKTTTLFVVLSYLSAKVKNNSKVVHFKRDINVEQFYKAFVVLIMSLIALLVSIIILLSTEPNLSFMSILFEAFSALGTVGLSMGITSSLSILGKIVIIILMFIGRLGPIAIVISLTKKKTKGNNSGIEYPEANILVG